MDKEIEEKLIDRLVKVVFQRGCNEKEIAAIEKARLTMADELIDLLACHYQIELRKRIKIF